MYVARNHTATVTTKNILEFSCVHCNSRREALVIGVGQGKGHSPFMLDDAGAKSRAASEAEVSSRKNAEEILKLARCPNCHMRDERAVTWKKTKAVLAALASFGFMIGLGFGLDALKNSSFGIWIFAPLGVFAAGFVYWLESAKLANVDGRVAFLEDETLKRC